MASWFKRLTTQKKDDTSWLRSFIAGSIFKISDIRGQTSLQDIRTQIDTMRALANDSQISTALSYYATDATTLNSSNQVIWATSKTNQYKEVADIINTKFRQWNVNAYARDHILELATIGNLYIPTSMKFAVDAGRQAQQAALDGNTIRDDSYEIIPSYTIPPENIIHVWFQGEPKGFVFQPDDKSNNIINYPESSVIHFTLGGLLGDYTIQGRGSDGTENEYDIQFGKPLMGSAVQPTQTLSLLEDAVLLSSLIRTVKFIAVECGSADDAEIQATLETLKSMIEQQLSLNTSNGDAQSFVNPQSPNNLIYLPKVNGQDPISITDLNMAEATDADNKLLDYYQNKKLSVLGVPKEAMNFSSAEGLGGAGAVMSQRSALYANALQRLETAYIEGWRSGLNKYFMARGMSGYVDQFELHMNPILTQMSTVAFEHRDAAVSQAQAIIDLLKNLGVTDANDYKQALTEILTESLPGTGTAVNSWDIDVTTPEGEGDAF